MAKSELQDQEFFDDSNKLSDEGLEVLDKSFDTLVSGEELTEDILSILKSDEISIKVVLEKFKQPLLEKVFSEASGNKEREDLLIQSIEESLEKKKKSSPEAKEDLELMMTRIQSSYSEAERNDSELKSQRELSELEKEVEKKIEELKNKYPEEFEKMFDVSKINNYIKGIQELNKEKEGRVEQSILSFKNKIIGGKESLSTKLRKITSSLSSINKTKLDEQIGEIDAFLEKSSDEAFVSGLDEKDIKLVKYFEEIRTRFEVEVKNYADSLVYGNDGILKHQDKRNLIARINGLIDKEKIESFTKEDIKDHGLKFSSGFSKGRFEELSLGMLEEVKKLTEAEAKMNKNYGKIDDVKKESIKSIEELNKREESVSLKSEHEVYMDEYNKAIESKASEIESDSEDANVLANLREITYSLKEECYGRGVVEEWKKLQALDHDSDRLISAQVESLREVYEKLSKNGAPLDKQILFYPVSGNEQKSQKEIIEGLLGCKFSKENLERKVGELLEIRKGISQMEGQLIIALENGETGTREIEENMEKAYEEIKKKEIEFFGYKGSQKLRESVLDKNKKYRALFDKDGNAGSEIIEYRKKTNERIRILQDKRNDIMKEMDKINDEGEITMLASQLRGVSEQIREFQDILDRKNDEIAIYKKSSPFMGEGQKESKAKYSKLGELLSEKYTVKRGVLRNSLISLIGDPIKDLWRLPSLSGGWNVDIGYAIAGHIEERNKKAQKLLVLLREKPDMSHATGTNWWFNIWERKLKRSIDREQEIIDKLEEKAEKGMNFMGRVDRYNSKLDRLKEKYSDIIGDDEDIVTIGDINDRRKIDKLGKEITKLRREGKNRKAESLREDMEALLLKMKKSKEARGADNELLDKLKKPEFLRGINESRSDAEERVRRKEENDRKMVEESFGILRNAGLDETLYSQSDFEKEFKDWKFLYKHAFIPKNIENLMIKPFLLFVKRRKLDHDDYKWKLEDLKILVEIFKKNEGKAAIFNSTVFRRDFMAEKCNTLRDYLGKKNASPTISTI